MLHTEEESPTLESELCNEALAWNSNSQKHMQEGKEKEEDRDCGKAVKYIVHIQVTCNLSTCTYTTLYSADYTNYNS